MSLAPSISKLGKGNITPIRPIAPIESTSARAPARPEDDLLQRYRRVRKESENLCRPLLIEDYVIQSMPDVSPPKWHLGHTSWFFETFILKERVPGYEPIEPLYGFIFNSYYEALGARVARPERGLLSRPSVFDTYAYRNHVNDAMEKAYALAPELTQLGIHHEQQHQELLLTDIKHILWTNPLRPTYALAVEPTSPEATSSRRWLRFEEGVHEIGFDGPGFAFDNERPRHKVFLKSYSLASHLVTNGEFREFVEAGGYENPALWLSDGWDQVRRASWRAPLYWEKRDGDWAVFTLSGADALDEDAPVSHLSYYEADAFARWRGKRLPTEAEWEAAATLDPSLCSSLWQWTSSAYGPYPGFRPASGAVGEYNGKFMSNRMVLRGGSWATPELHHRVSYRNFFDPSARWQFTGVRLAT